MKTSIRIKAIFATLAIATAFTVAVESCKTPESITMKTGAQLWGENCNRCHNAPDPHTFSDDQWDAACEHMHQKALLTDTEIAKIRDFLKQAN